jgi:hypothetical protein
MGSGGRRRAAKLGTSALLLAGVSVGVLELGKDLIGSFEPRTQIIMLAALTVFTATLAAAHLKNRIAEKREAEERGGRLKASLRLWPAPTARAVEPEELGCFPRRAGVEERYIPRAADASLRAAIVESPLVVVVGPASAGKSRSGVEAIREALPDGSLLVVPENGPALRTMLEVDSELRHVGDPAKQRVVWLDGAMRYLETLEPVRLLSLLDKCGVDGRPPVTVVATVRKRAWEEALHSESALSETGKMLLAHARVVELPADLTPEEREEAGAAFPGADFAGGIGAALAGGGDGWSERRRRTDGAARQESLAIDGPVDWWRDHLLVILWAVPVLALLFGGWLGIQGEFSKPPAPSIDEQVRTIRKDGGVGDRVGLTMADGVAFGGTEEKSFVFQFKDDPDKPPQQPRPEEIQVWDRHGEELELAFHFRPREEGVYQYRGLGDVDGDGAEEMVGGYGTRLIPGELLVPFVLDWDEDTGAYRLVSLAPERPRLAMRPLDPEARRLRREYLEPLDMPDHRQGAKLMVGGYRAQDFAVTEDYRLLSAYVLGVDEDSETRVVEVRPAIFTQIGGTPRVVSCELDNREAIAMRVPLSRRGLLYKELEERWPEIAGRRPCAPVR